MPLFQRQSATGAIDTTYRQAARKAGKPYRRIGQSKEREAKDLSDRCYPSPSRWRQYNLSGSGPSHHRTPERSKPAQAGSFFWYPSAGTRVDGVARLDVDELPQQSVRKPLWPSESLTEIDAVFALSRTMMPTRPLRCLSVKPTGSPMKNSSRCARGCGDVGACWTARSIRDNRRVWHRPTLPALVDLDHRPGLPQFPIDLFEEIRPLHDALLRVHVTYDSL